MDLRLRSPELIHWAVTFTLLSTVALAGLLVAWRGRRPMHRAWIVAIALQALLIGDAVAASRSARADDDGGVESVLARVRGNAHADSAELFARAGAAVLALAAAAAALGGDRHSGPSARARRRARALVRRPGAAASKACAVAPRLMARGRVRACRRP